MFCFRRLRLESPLDYAEQQGFTLGNPGTLGHTLSTHLFAHNLSKPLLCPGSQVGWFIQKSTSSRLLLSTLTAIDYSQPPHLPYQLHFAIHNVKLLERIAILENNPVIELQPHFENILSNIISSEIFEMPYTRFINTEAPFAASNTNTKARPSRKSQQHNNHHRIQRRGTQTNPSFTEANFSKPPKNDNPWPKDTKRSGMSFL